MNNYLVDLEKLSIPYKTCEPLKKHTSFKIGGNAEYFITPESVNQCRDAINCCKNHSVKYKIIGKGSNLLVHDEGYSGAIICTSFLNDIKLLDGNKIYCEAGVTLANVCFFALNCGLSGLEFAYDAFSLCKSLGPIIYVRLSFLFRVTRLTFEDTVTWTYNEDTDIQGEDQP